MVKAETHIRSVIFVTGLLFGWLQTALFLNVSVNLSSGFRTYLLITVAWLIGSLIGVALAARTHISLSIMPVVTLVAFVMVLVSLSVFTFNTTLWGIYGLMGVVIGIYPGMFFAQIRRCTSAQALFLWENNGFILGLILGTLVFIVWGRLVVLAGIVGLTIACVLSYRRTL